MDNVNKLKIYAHDDHANGLEKFFELNDHARLYVAGGCEENCYDRHGLFFKYAGIPRGELGDKVHAFRTGLVFEI